MKNNIKNKVYVGSELIWSVEDVLDIASHLDIDISEEEATKVLFKTFNQNEELMGWIREEMEITLTKYKLK